MTRRKFSREFKIEAVRLVTDRGVAVAQAARDLDVAESGLRCSSRAAIARFQKILESHGVTATVRRTLGSDIDASCGQLRRKFEAEGG